PRGLESAQIEAFPSIAMEQRAKAFFADPTKPTSEESKAFLDSALAMIKEYVETETELWRALQPKKEFLRALKVRVDAVGHSKEATIARLKKLYDEIRKKESLCNWQTRLLLSGIILYCCSLFVSHFLKYKIG